jgi:hypothetical protein
MKRHATSFACLLFCLLLSNSAAAADTSGDFSMPLFDGQTLNGWQVTGCDVVVKDGMIAIEDGNGLVRTNGQYSDFVLELDWKALHPEMWDSGIYFRCNLPPEGRPWPPRYQVNLRKGMEGNVNGLDGAKSEGLCKDGDWNHFKFTVKGSAAELEINGKPAWKGEGLEQPCGYICLQSEVPGGGKFLFRNVRITELGYKSLFDGKSLDGWSQSAEKSCWEVKDGSLMCTGEKGSSLHSLEEYGDFNLRLQYKLNPGGNSGVFARIPTKPNQGRHIEIQILDNPHPRYAKIKPYQHSGSLYAIVPASQYAGLPVGEWNNLEINCTGPDYRVTLNGVVVVDAKAADVPELAKHPKSGLIGLQNHSEEVYFRNIRIGPAQN